MSPEQRKRVAEVVTNNGWRILGPLVVEDTGYAVCSADAVWNPSFTDEDWQRSQALAVVEWLADNTDGGDQWIFVSDCMSQKNIEKLERLVLEVCDE